MDAGFHRIRLAKHNIELALENYEWNVIAKFEDIPEVVAQGFIQRIKEPVDLSIELSRADKSNFPAIYAKFGMFYEALEAISDLVDSDSDNVHYRRERLKLLSQVALQFEPKDGDINELTMVITNKK